MQQRALFPTIDRVGLNAHVLLDTYHTLPLWELLSVPPTPVPRMLVVPPLQLYQFGFSLVFVPRTQKTGCWYAVQLGESVLTSSPETMLVRLDRAFDKVRLVTLMAHEQRERMEETLQLVCATGTPHTSGHLVDSRGFWLKEPPPPGSLVGFHPIICLSDDR